MSERSFAVGIVVLALAFGLVVPDPGAPPSAAAGIGMAEPAVPRPVQQEKEMAVHTVAFAANHAGPQKAGGRPAVLWTAGRPAP